MNAQIILFNRAMLLRQFESWDQEKETFIQGFLTLDRPDNKLPFSSRFLYNRETGDCRADKFDFSKQWLSDQCQIPFTPAELEIWNMSAKLLNKIIALGEPGQPSDPHNLTRGIDRIQDAMLYRVNKRQWPDELK